MTLFCLLTVAHAVAQPISWHAAATVMRLNTLYCARCARALHQLAQLACMPNLARLLNHPRHTGAFNQRK